jgi:hypothetical protein
VTDAPGYVLPQVLYPDGYSATRTLRMNTLPSQAQTAAAAAAGAAGDSQQTATFVSSITKGPQGPVFRVVIRPPGVCGGAPWRYPEAHAHIHDACAAAMLTTAARSRCLLSAHGMCRIADECGAGK